jgi:hypothetical protein
MIAVQGKSGKGRLVANDHPKMPLRHADLVEEQVDAPGIIADQPQNIAKGIRVSREEGQVEADFGITVKGESFIGGEVERGPSVLYGLIVIKTQTEGWSGLAGQA